MFSASVVAAARKKTILLVVAIDLLLIAATMANGHPNIWSDFDKEKNAWTFGNSLNMVFVCIVAYVNYLLLANAGDRRRRKLAWVWGLLAFSFLFLSADDFLMLHERGGHAVENAAPFLSRQHIALYMDDLIQLSYTILAAIFGLVVLRKLLTRQGTRFFTGAIVSNLVAIAIGLNPAMKSLPLPMALIQIFQLISVFLFFISFLSFTQNELISTKEATKQQQIGKSTTNTTTGG